MITMSLLLSILLLGGTVVLVIAFPAMSVTVPMLKLVTDKSQLLTPAPTV
ncbi:MAG: hypothetical protein MAG581_02739 [Deltaproteobacteria bacterium]|nr:hypothetical protein [Deltaproteobacteria bacterium]